MFASLTSLQLALAAALDGALSPLASRAAQPPVRLQSQEQRDAADRCLHAGDCDDLADRLDAEHKALLLTVTQASKGPDDFATLASNVKSKPLDMPSLRLTLGDSNAETCVLGFEALKTFLSQFATLMEISKAITATAPAPAETKPPRADVWEALLDPALPLSFRRGLLDVLRSVAATVVIARAEEFGKRLEPWLARALADHFANGFVLLSKLPDMLTNLVSLGESLRAETAASDEFSERLAKWRAEAEALGEPAYSPLGQLDS